MSNDAGLLQQEEHDRILREQVLRKRDFVDATPQDRPKAIVLAGQPGAGKGGLKGRAEIEFDGNVVSIDPDELRDAHPKVREFQNAHPYTWSGDTHPDASAWAQELRTAAVDGRKNIIIDTTLGGGKNAVDMIKELQSKGYDVEIRAVAAHRLESELGVNGRFAESLDEKGYGRYVPEEVRIKVYTALPNNLDLVQKETGIPIRLFNREGAELYNSRTDTRLPGVALEEAREARLKDPNITRGLRDGWKEQQTWHRELPKTLPHNPKVEPMTRENLLTERNTNKVVDAVERGTNEAVDIDQTTRVRPARLQTGGALGLTGLALEVYSFKQTLQHADTQRNTLDNPVAANETLLRHGAQAGGGAVGGALGFGAASALGLGSGGTLALVAAEGYFVSAVFDKTVT